MIKHTFSRNMVNNHVFFQHPDLIRNLRMNENVMAIMMNTLGRRAQAQSDVQVPQSQGAIGDMESTPAAPTEKVSFFNAF